MEQIEFEFEKKIFRLKKISSLITDLNHIFYSLEEDDFSRKTRIRIQLENYRKEYLQVCSEIEKKSSSILNHQKSFLKSDRILNTKEKFSF